MRNRFKTKIRLNGKNTTLSFSQNFWFLLHEEIGAEFQEVMKLFSETAVGSVQQGELVTSIIINAVKANDMVEGIEREYNRFLFREWIEELDGTNTQEIVRVMMLSKGIDIDRLDKDVKKMKRKENVKSLWKRFLLLFGINGKKK